MMNEYRASFEAGRDAARHRQPPAANPYVPSDPDSKHGRLARFWRDGYRHGWDNMVRTGAPGVHVSYM